MSYDIVDKRTVVPPSPSTGEGPEPPQGARRTLMLVVMMAGTFSASFSVSMMNIALPHVADGFHVSLSIANWIIIGYTIVAATFITMAASLLKRVGIRKLFIIACAALAAGSVLGMLAFDFPVLIIARLVQAISNGLLFPAVTAVIVVIVAKERRGTVLAMNSGIIGIGQAVGPLVSGLLLTWFDLHVMFLPPALFGIALVIAGMFVLRDVEAREHIPIDPFSVALSFVGLAFFLLGLEEITHDFLVAALGLVVGLVLLAIFVRRQLSLTTPLVSLRPLKQPRFTIGIMLVMLAMMASASMSLLLPLFYEGCAGDTPFTSGLFIAGPLVCYGLLSILAGEIFDRKGIWPMVPLGFLFILIGFISILISSADLLVALVVALSFLVYGGVSFIVAPSKTIALDELSSDLYSHGAVLNSIFVQIANAIGAALFVGVLSADVLRETAAGLSRADAYAMGFSHTLIISIVLGSLSLILAIIYAWHLRDKIKAKPSKKRHGTAAPESKR